MQTVDVVADSVSGSAFNANQGVSLAANTVSSSQFTSSQTVNVNATTVSGSNLTAPIVTATADTFDGSVSASNGATITGGDISGAFTGGSFTLAGTGSVNATVTAVNLTVTAPQGAVGGNWQNLAGSGGGVVANNSTTPPPVVVAPVTPVTPVTPVAPVTPVTPINPVTPVTPVTPTNPVTPVAPVTPTKPANVSLPTPNQIVATKIPLPAVATVAPPPGPVVLPQSMVLALISPGGPTGTPKLIQVQGVQDLGSLLGDGYTAIVIDLSGHTKDKKAEAVASAR